MKQIVLITGATSGFGQAAASLFAENGYRVIITGRREDRLRAMEDSLRSAFQADILSLTFDVQDKKAVDAAIAGLPAAWRDIAILVNNAGLALGRDAFDQAPMADWEQMLDTNVKGLLYVTRAVLPLMVPHRRGHIINLGSIAGNAAYDKGNVYCASKRAVASLSESMRIELLPHRIRVTLIAPGAAETEFSLVRFRQDDREASKVYDGFVPLSASDVAAAIFWCAGLPEHVCVNHLEITPLAQASAGYLYKDPS